jgi:hypothetical protein
MHHRTLTFAAVAAGAFLFPLGDAAAPTTLKYKIVQRMEQTIDATAMGQGEQKIAMGYSAYLTIVVDDSASGRTVRGVVDSLVPDSDAEPTVMAALSRTRGASATAFVGPDGKIASYTEKADSAGTGATALRALLTSIFPPVKLDAQAGETWTDTTTATDTVNGMPTTRKSVVTYKAEQGAAVGGAGTLKLDVSGTYNVGGANDQGIVFEGAGTQSGTFQRTARGVLVDGTFNDNANMTISIPQAPEPIPMSTVSAVTITLLQ